MGNRIILFGRVHLSESAYESAQVTPLLETFVMDDDGVSAHPQSMTAKDLFSAADAEFRAWARNIYDPPERCWLFACSLHDDDWANADPEMFTQALAALKDEGESDVVFTFAEGRQQLDEAWRIDPGKSSPVAVLPILPKAISELLFEGNIEEAAAQIRPLVR